MDRQERSGITPAQPRRNRRQKGDE
jgi:hypothetical protein